MNQEAEGTGVARQGAGGATQRQWGGGGEQGEPVNRTAAGGLQQGRGLTPGQGAHSWAAPQPRAAPTC